MLGARQTTGNEDRMNMGKNQHMVKETVLIPKSKRRSNDLWRGDKGPKQKTTPPIYREGSTLISGLAVPSKSHKKSTIGVHESDTRGTWDGNSTVRH